jgi:hypothetical protein
LAQIRLLGCQSILTYLSAKLAPIRQHTLQTHVRAAIDVLSRIGPYPTRSGANA